MTISAVWTIADIFNGLMALPNLIAIVALSGVIASETKYFLISLETDSYSLLSLRRVDKQQSA